MQQLAKFLSATGRRLRTLGEVVSHLFRKGKLGLKIAIKIPFFVDVGAQHRNRMGPARVSAGGLGLDRPGRLAPGFATTCPGPGQSVGDQDITEAMAISQENAKGAAVAILVATRPRLQFEWSLVHQFDQPLGRAITESKFRGAFRFADLRCIDVGNPDFRAIDPQCIAVNDAGDPLAVGAFSNFTEAIFGAASVIGGALTARAMALMMPGTIARIASLRCLLLSRQKSRRSCEYAKRQMLLFHRGRGGMSYRGCKNSPTINDGLPKG